MHGEKMKVRIFLEKDVKVTSIRVWKIKRGVYYVFMMFNRRIDILGFGDNEHEGEKYTTILICGLGENFECDESYAEIGFQGDYHYDFWAWKDVVEGVLIEEKLYNKIVKKKPIIMIERE